MTAAQYFSTDPADARRMFLAACLDAALPVASFEAPRKEQAEFPVHIDVARAGTADAEAVIVLCPGGRMAEGLCASGIQTAILRTGLQIELPNPFALVLVHTVWPSAFEAAALDELIEPTAVAAEWDDSLLAAAEFRLKEESSGVQEPSLQDHEQQQWCRHVLSNVAERFLVSAQHLVFLDVRTGSGPYGEAEVVSCHLPGSEDEARAIEMFGARGAANGVAVSNLQGPVARGLAAALPDRQMTSVVLEFGCYSLATVLDSLLSRHELRAAGNTRFDGLFYPDADDWRDRVFESAADLLQLGFRSIDRMELVARPA